MTGSSTNPTPAPGPDTLGGASLRIVQLCADRGIAPGATKGAAQHLRGIAVGLADLGHHVTTVTARKPEGPFPVEVLPLDTIADGSPGVGPDDRLGPIDVVYERYSLGHLGGLALARARGARFVLEVNAPLLAEASAHRPGTVDPGDAAVETRLLTEADLVITVSSALTDWVAQQGRTGPTLTLPNGFEPSWFTTDAVAPTHDLVFLGHPKPWHGADRLIPLLGTLDHEFGVRASLLVIGGGSGADDLATEAARAGVADQLTITGALPPEVASARLADARIGLAPYHRQEPFYFCPLKIVDYLAAGLPVVSTAQGDIPDLVGPAGIIVDPDDAGALAAAVADLLRRPDIAARLGRAGRQRARTEMTWSHVARRTADAIADLFPDRPAPAGLSTAGLSTSGLSPAEVG